MAKGTLKSIGRYSTIGMEMVACVLIGTAIGYFIEKKIESIRPWATLVFTMLGFFAGIKRLLDINKNIKNQDYSGDKRD